MLIKKTFGCLPGYSKFYRTYCAVAGVRSASDGLLGPPELYLSVSSDRTCRTQAVDNNKSSVEDATTKSGEYSSGACMRFTENRSPTYLTTTNHCLDFFFHIVPSTPSNIITQRLEKVWEQDPSTALKLVYNLLGVRGTGKSDQEGFYTSALWLHENHPKTLTGNVESVARFGYFKNLLELLYRLIEGPTVRQSEKEMLQEKRLNGGDKWWRTDAYKTMGKPKREENRLKAAGKGMTKYRNDPNYRLLHDRISQVFAVYLESDLEKLKAGNYEKISLAAKWCPSLYSSFDNYTSLCESIARRLFPREKFSEYEGIEDAHYAYRVRDRLRKQVLVPLRKALDIPEVYMSAREWNSVVYSRVASIAMKNYKELFIKHDMERFEMYLGNVKKGTAKIAAGALLPHEIVKAVKEEAADEVAELQWKRIVDDLSKLGKLKNCLAICDVSGSMYGEPLKVSVALGLLVSELSEEPWKGKLITFSEQPQLQVIVGEDLRSKFACIEGMNWGMNTDFQKVFDRILEVAVEGKLTDDQMIKRLFVFSDMEFDDARGGCYETYSHYYYDYDETDSHSSANCWETDYQAIQRKFNDKGFSRVPEIVFWNLRCSSATPVQDHQPGVALVSGFSKNFLKLFLNEGDIPGPVKIMEAAISGKEYQKLIVLD